MTSAPSRDPGTPDPDSIITEPDLPKKTGLDALDDLEFFDDKPLISPVLTWMAKTGEKVAKAIEENKKKRKDELDLKRERKREQERALVQAMNAHISELRNSGKTQEEITTGAIHFLKDREVNQFAVYRLLEPNYPDTEKGNLKRTIKQEFAPQQSQRPQQAPRTAPAPANNTPTEPREPGVVGRNLEKFVIAGALPALAVSGLAAYGLYKGARKSAKIAWEGGKELVKGTGKILLQTGETLIVNPFKLTYRVLKTPFVKARDFAVAGKNYPKEAKKGGKEGKPKFLSRLLRGSKQAVLIPAGALTGFVYGLGAGVTEGIAKDVIGVQWATEEVGEGDEKKKKRTYSFNHGGLGGITAATLNTVKGTLYDGPKRAFGSKEVLDKPEDVAEACARVLEEKDLNDIKAAANAEEAVNVASTFLAAKGIDPIKFFSAIEASPEAPQNKVELLGDLTRAGKSAWKILSADAATDEDVESAIDDAVDLLNLEKYGAFWAFAGTGVMGAKKLLWPSIRPAEIHWDTFGLQIEQLEKKEDIQAFLKGLDMKSFKQKFRLLLNPDRLEAALQTDEGRKQAKKQLGIYIGRPDEDIDGQELAEKLVEMRQKLGNPNELARSVRENYFALAGTLTQVAAVVTPDRLTLMHTGTRETMPDVDYDHFGDQVLERLDTDQRRDAFLRVFNPATFERSFRLLVSEPRLVKAVADDKEALKRQADILFDLGGVFDQVELNAHADAIMARLGNPSAILDPLVREKCQQARTLVDQCRTNLLSTGTIDAIFAKPLTFTNIDYDRFGDQLLEEVNTPEEINAFLRGFRMHGFERAFRILIIKSTLVDVMEKNPKVVQKKIEQLFDLSDSYSHAEVIHEAQQLRDLFRTHPFASPELATKAGQLVTTVDQIVKNLEEENVVARLMEKPKEKIIDVQKFGTEVVNIKDEEVLSALRNINGYAVTARFGNLRNPDLVDSLSESQESKDQLKALIAQFFGVDTPISPYGIESFKDHFNTRFNPPREDRIAVQNFNELSRLIRDIGATLNASRLQKIYKKEEKSDAAEPAKPVAEEPKEVKVVEEVKEEEELLLDFDVDSFEEKYSPLLYVKTVEELMTTQEGHNTAQELIRDIFNIKGNGVVTYDMVNTLRDEFRAEYPYKDARRDSEVYKKGKRMDKLLNQLQFVLNKKRLEKIFAPNQKTA